VLFKVYYVYDMCVSSSRVRNCSYFNFQFFNFMSVRNTY
jgi:hypothetical protein